MTSRISTAAGGKQVVIIGHGQSGCLTAQNLVKLHSAGAHKVHADGALKIIVIDSRDFYEVDSLMTYSLTTGGEAAYDMHSCEQWELAVPGVDRYITDTVASVATNVGDGFTVTTAGGSTVHADAVVCATGFTIPMLKPSIGAAWPERRAEVAKLRAALKAAKNVVIAGSGNAGMDMAGDTRLFMDIEGGAKLHLIVSGELVLDDRVGKGDRTALTKKIREAPGMVLHNDRVVGDNFRDASLTPTTVTLKSGKTIPCDVYLPVFARFVAEDYLSGIAGATAKNGMVEVDPLSLEAKVAPGLFAVGCSTVTLEEGVIDAPRLQGQTATVAHNVLNFLAKNPYKVHKTPMSFAGHEMYSMFGHGDEGYGQCNTEGCGFPGFCLRLCGFPLPCLCGCWLCGCSEGPCGWSCSRPGGRGLSQAHRKMILDKADQTPVMKFKASNAANVKQQPK